VVAVVGTADPPRSPGRLRLAVWGLLVVALPGCPGLGGRNNDCRATGQAARHLCR